MSVFAYDSTNCLTNRANSVLCGMKDIEKKLKKYEIAERRYEAMKSELENHIFGIAKRVDDARHKPWDHNYIRFEIYGVQVTCTYRDGDRYEDNMSFPEKLIYSEEEVEDYITLLNKKELDAKKLSARAELARAKRILEMAEKDLEKLKKPLDK